MRMLAFVLIALSDTYPAAEAVVDEAGRLVCADRAAESRARTDLVVLDPGRPEGVAERLELVSPDQDKRWGPVSWGMNGDAYHFVVFNSAFGGLTTECRTFPLTERLRMKRAVREENRVDHEARLRGGEYAVEHDRHLGFFFNMLMKMGLEESIDYKEAFFPFDLAFTADNHALFTMIRDGRMRWWTWNRPEETDWVERDAVATEIDSAFRIMRAGDDLYLVDGEGRVYSSPAEGHRVVGSINGWRAPRDGEALFLLEEHRLEKIAAIYVGESAIEVLPFAGEAGATEDFITNIDDPFVRDGLVRMTAILNGDDGEGGE